MQEWWNEPCRQPDEAARIRAMARQDQLTKPRGALGQLEALAVNLAALQACDRPAVERLHLCVFAGDHGMVEEGVSAYPQAVTGQMLHNFVAGGAALSVLARRLGAVLEVIDPAPWSRWNWPVSLICDWGRPRLTSPASRP